MQKRWVSWPRFVGRRSAGSPFLVMHTWSPAVRVEYGSRASNPLNGTKHVPTFFSCPPFCAGNFFLWSRLPYGHYNLL